MAKDTRPQINIRAKAEEIGQWTEAANLNGLSLSAWLRMIALRAARKDIKHAEQGQ
jgi:uncharacterized protein (DUF1778 family)